MATEKDKFYAFWLLFLSPFFFVVPAYAAAYAANACIGAKSELYVLWLIVALPILASYTPLSILITDSAYRIIMAATGILYGYLFASLTVPQVACGWPLGDFARVSEVAWAASVAIYYALHAAFKIPPSYIALLAASEFHIFYLLYTLPHALQQVHHFF